MRNFRELEHVRSVVGEGEGEEDDEREVMQAERMEV